VLNDRSLGVIGLTIGSNFVRAVSRQPVTLVPYDHMSRHMSIDAMSISRTPVAGPLPPACAYIVHTSGQGGVGVPDAGVTGRLPSYGPSQPAGRVAGRQSGRELGRWLGAPGRNFHPKATGRNFHPESAPPGSGPQNLCSRGAGAKLRAWGAKRSSFIPEKSIAPGYVKYKLPALCKVYPTT
jgi:hypothetical protein